MANVTAQKWNTPIYIMTPDDMPIEENVNSESFSSGEGSPNTVTYYLMRWKDEDCPGVTYRTWVVTQIPDPTGIRYGGSKCGATAISGAVVAASWTA